MQWFDLTQELREALDEPALQLMELYEADLTKEIPSGLDNADLTELRGYINKDDTPLIIQQIGDHLTIYSETKGEAALRALAQELQPDMAKIKSKISEFKEAKRLELVTKQLEKELGEPFGILALSPSLVTSLYPFAQEKFNEWIKELHEEIPGLEGLTREEIIADINDNDNLEDWRKEYATKYAITIKDWLLKSIDIGVSATYNYHDEIWRPMLDLKFFLKRVYERKEVKAEEERRRQEEAAKKAEDNRNWNEAFDRIYTLQLSKDIRRYAPRYEEEIIQACVDATDAYIKEGADNYLESYKTSNYRFWLGQIKKLKEEERQQIAANQRAVLQQNVANSEAREYNIRLDKEKTRLKALLSPAEKGTWSSLPDRIKARCYRGQPLHQILSKEEISDLDGKNRKTGDSKLREIVSGEFSQFFDGEYYRNFYFLTVAEYSYEGLPCLDFGFDVLADVEVRVSLKPRPKTFRGHTYNLPMKENAAKELLGSLYFVTGEDFGYTFYQTIPLVLVMALFNGEIPKGIIPTLVGEDIVTYKIPKYKEEVTIHDRFESYLKDIGSIDEMIKRGILSEKVGNIVKRELEKLKGASPKEQETPVVQEASPQKAKILRKDTLKAKAFRLFDEGKRPSDLEVKALKIKPGVLYGYYQKWKKLTAQ